MIKPGIYKKTSTGRIYKILFTATNPNNQEPFVVFQRLYENCAVRILPYAEFEEKFEPFSLDTLDYYFDKIALLCIKDRKVLMARSKGKEHFYLPGGKREKGETDLECLARECREELNVKIDASSAFLYGTYAAYAYADKPCAQLKMYFANFKGTPTASSEIEEIGWLSYADREKAIGSGRPLMDELYWKGLID